MASFLVARYHRFRWGDEHATNVKITGSSLYTNMLIGDSLIQGLSRFDSVWSGYLEPLGTLNFGIGGDLIQNVLWRIEHGEVPLNLKVAVLHCGTNNLSHNNPAEISWGIAAIVNSILRKKPNVEVIVAGLLPRGSEDFAVSLLQGENHRCEP